VLFDGGSADRYVVQGGLLSRHPAPTHEAMFSTPQREYALDPARQSLIVPFHWRDGDVEVTKRFEFTRGSYLVSVSYEVRNGSGQPWRGQLYSQIKRAIPDDSGPKLIYTYTGPVLSAPANRYEKIQFDDIDNAPAERQTADGWAAMLQHYFLTALIPADAGEAYAYRIRRTGDGAAATAFVDAIAPAHEIAPGESAVLAANLYMGPKLQHVLEQIAEGLDLTVDYGSLWIIAKPLYWCLEWLHGLTGNWGWAIVLVTVLLKLAFFHLSAAGYRSMANMRRVQPRIIALRDRYKDDRARLNQAMMQIYKEEKINPFGGCLPILIQIPVFIALYWVLLESVELRQAPWVLWIRDLSTKDPYYVLPLVMGVTMFVQQKLNPAAMDPVQEKVLQIMPFMFTIFFAFFPSGLVLYWVVNNILSIAQQWVITKHIVQPAPPAAP
jgi:YidC/Oxa1 family membrane protein insertase